MTCGTSFWLDQDAGSRDPSRALPTDCALVSRGYFAAMGIPVLDGRPFDRGDRMGSPRVLVVNSAFAKRYFGDGRAVGHRIFVQGSGQALAEIIGIVGDVRHKALTSEPAPAVFLLHAQTPGYITNLVVRTSGEPIGHAAEIRRAIHDIDPTQAVSSVGTVEQDVAKVLARPRLEAALVSCFAIMAMALAAIGIYGLIAYIVTLRTHEIGIRLALGATREQVFFEVLGKGSRLVLVGMIGGVSAALALCGTLNSKRGGSISGRSKGLQLERQHIASVHGGLIDACLCGSDSDRRAPDDRHINRSHSVLSD